MDFFLCHGKCQRDNHEIQMIFHGHEDYISDNRISIFAVTTTIHKNEHQYSSTLQNI